ncbi:histidine kinase dimerization/phosphoacceptor domain -containing protein [Fodinibius saliphilus]|uniref:histidine kinase dimerization/phosphoacceptor domain -containing protein n=1 Tax=Fodinibius saliphilus TaxID=1920650 RepID=UPI0011090348|nr:histidine kinase dimerization/phosphoacceptor domain -containing protein [Fodinibius saliphilus]
MPSANKAYPGSISGDSLQMLLEEFSSLNRAVELKGVLQRSLEIIKKVMSSEASSLILLDEDSQELVVSIPSGPVRHEVRGKRISQDEGVAGWVLEHEQPYFSNNLEETGIFGGELSDNFTTESIICVPLSGKNGKVIGVLEAINRKGEKGFSEDDIPVFKALSEHVAHTIERTRELENLQQRAQDKEIMLTEVSHRIKNNLLTITALIEMEMPEVDEVSKEVLQKTCARIDSMAEIHDLLYHNDLKKEIDLGEYIGRLTEKISSMLANPSQDIAVRIKAESVSMDTERGMCCGLLLNELLVNAYKHAFKDDVATGEIQIDLVQNENMVQLEVADNGEGLKDDFSLGNTESVGSWLIDVLLRRLEASMEINREGGASFVISFEQ